MLICIVIVLAAILLVGLIGAEKTNAPSRILFFKIPLSFLFILVWGLQPYQNTLVSILVGVALVCCLGGDVLLAFGASITFSLGLIAFLCGHLLFASAFFINGTIGPGMAVGVILVGVAAKFIWRWLAPHLGHMTIPALAYLVVISIMVCGAWSILLNGQIPHQARVGMLVGAVLFYLSDIAVARQRFVINDHRNRIVGLPLYYGAQFILAYSASWIPT